jgi:hypothetical protein
LAESYYAASNEVGWMDIVVGDPLCRAYPSPVTALAPDAPIAHEGTGPGPKGRAGMRGRDAVRVWATPAKRGGDAELRTAQGRYQGRYGVKGR